MAQKTNVDIFNEVFDLSIMAPAILREALQYYIELLEETIGLGYASEESQGWLTEAKRVQSLLNKGYSGA